METKEKETIIDGYIEWWNQRASEVGGYGTPGDPYRKAAFRLWLHYNHSAHEADCDELHAYLREHTNLTNV